MFEATYVPDGYELDFYVARVENLHGSVRGKYRPLSVDERDGLREAINSKKAADYDPILRHALVEKLVSWDVVGPNGLPVAISAATLKGLHPKVFDKIYLIVAGDRPSDVPPDASPREEVGYVERLAMHAAGKSPEAEAVKN